MVRSPAQCVAIADCIGTAASFPRRQRRPYEDNDLGDGRSGRSLSAVGNEGFNLDPPRVDPVNGEMAALKAEARSALHQRHKDKGNVLWVDGHCSGESLRSLGYQVNEDGVVRFDGNNRMFSIRRTNKAWTNN